MENTTFDWQISEYMIYCRSRQLREKSMNSYEQTLRLFERWCVEQLKIENCLDQRYGVHSGITAFPDSSSEV